MPTKSKKQDHKVKSLHALNDAETYIIITEDACAIKGTLVDCTTMLAETMIINNNIRKMVMTAIESIITAYDEDEDDDES